MMTLGLLILSAGAVHAATDAVVSGTVKDPAGAPFRGAFVRAQKYTIENYGETFYPIITGDIRFGICRRASMTVRVFSARIQERSASAGEIGGGRNFVAGFRAAAGNASLERSFHVSGQGLWPEGEGKDILTGNCFRVPRISNPHGCREARSGRLDDGS